MVTAYLSDSNFIYLGPLYNKKMRYAPLLVGLHEPDIHAHKMLRYGHQNPHMDACSLCLSSPRTVVVRWAGGQVSGMSRANREPTTASLSEAALHA